MNNKKLKYLIAATIILMGIITTIAYFILKPKPATNIVVINTDEQPYLGSKKSRINIVAFEDLKCLNCKLYSNNLFPKIKEKYIDTGIAKYTMINLAFIPNSMPAANAAHCLYAQNKNYFFKFVDYIYQNQPDENTDWATIAKLLEFAKAATPKADLNDLSTCMITGRYNNFIKNNLKIASEAMNEQVATPAVYINGRKVDQLNIDRVSEIIKEIN